MATGLVAALLVLACDGDRPVRVRSTTAYVGAETCGGCHAEELLAWTGSDHERAMAVAGPRTVLGDFGDVTFREAGVETRFFRDGDRYLVRTEGPSGQATFEVKYTFGIRPLQQYLVELPGGRLQALTVAWHVEDRRWFSLRPGESPKPGDWRHWTGGASSWNAMCADCHSTAVHRNYDPAAYSYATTVSEINVACEACHGPGSGHVAWARADPAERKAVPRSGLTVNLQADGAPDAEIETCAPCHAVRQTVAPGWVPGSELLDHYLLELLTESLYFPDGQAREEVFEYGSYRQSRMYAAGVRCSACHEPHSTRLRVEGNALCTRCHTAAEYDTVAHHFHPDGSAGAACVECHMPARTFMQVDDRRDHGFRVPRPDLSLELGTPDACTGCHDEQTAAWARARLVEWYRGPYRGGRHFASVLAAGRRGERGADSALARLARDSAAPDIVRATAVSLLEPYRTETARRTALRALGDPAALARVAAVRTFEAAPEAWLPAVLVPRLEDPIRAVRVEAARVLARVADRILAVPEAATAFRMALEEYRGSLRAVNDQPEGHLARGVLSERLGDGADAERAYRTALRLDPSYVAAHVNLAGLLTRRLALEPSAADGVREEAESHLRRALELEPESAEASYALGLLLAEEPTRMAEAAKHLAAAARARPRQPRLQYNAGLAFQHLGRRTEAEEFLFAAYRLEPRNPDFLNALSIFFIQGERWEDALRYTDALLALYPDADALVERRASIESEIHGGGPSQNAGTRP